MFDALLIPNKSIAGILWAALLVFIIPFVIRQRKKSGFIALLLVHTFFVSLLIMSNSRAGWIGCISGIVFIAFRYAYLRKRKIILAAATIFITIFFVVLLFYKKDSSSGRIYIYRISLEMLQDNWVHGIGRGKFKARFNEYQASYFSLHDIDSKRALLADNTFYAFNDYLQWIIETGFMGLLLLLVALYFISKRIICLHRKNKNKPLLTAATASLICVAVSAMFSYPLQVIPIQGMVLLCLGIILFYNKAKDTISIWSKWASFFFRITIIVLTALYIDNTRNEVMRKQMEKNILGLSRSGYKAEVLNRYKQLAEEYPAVGNNWFLYARQLYYSNRLPEAMVALNKCRLAYVDNKVYKLKGDIEWELNMFDSAEKSYLRAIHMVPNRMGSRIDLVNFYVTRKDTSKAIYWARSVLNMPVKVPSSKIDSMLKQASSILKSLANTKVSCKEAEPQINNE